MQFARAGGTPGALGSPTTFGGWHGRQVPKSEKFVPVQFTHVSRRSSGPVPGAHARQLGAHPEGTKSFG